jgi:dihydroneopterin aldolase
VLAGADIVRVHDVAAAVDAVRVAEAVRAAGRAAAEETVGVRGLLFEACHGAYPEEREEKQPFVVDIEVGFCVGAGEDALEPSRDYTQLARAAAAVLQGPQRNLLETLAQEVVAEVRRRLPAVRRVRVEIQKPRAQLGVPGQGSFVRAEWRG